MLDANPATYLGAPEESIFAYEPVFTLYALVNSESPDAPDPFVANNKYYLSAALIGPEVDPDLHPLPDLGFYTLDGSPFNVVSDMTYGIPPIALVSNPGLLPPHGVYETYYIEHEFLLGPADENTTLYNSQDFPGGPDLFADGSLYYRAFNVDISGLDSGYFLHFDLYTKGSLPIDKFAPFSHDLTTTPVPASVILGMLGLGIAGLKLRKYA
jgi:hypothetical protein